MVKLMTLSRGTMKTEVIVDRIDLMARDERFIEWMEGWLRARYVVDAYLRHNGAEVAFILRKDMFELFGEMYRVVEEMRRVLNAKEAVALCQGDECIDLSENYEDGVLILVSNYKIRRLEKAKNVVKRLLEDDKLEDIMLIGEGGRIWINIKCRNELLYVDEAISLSHALLEKMYKKTGLRILKNAADEILKVIGLEGLLKLENVEIEDAGLGFELLIGGCKIYLGHNDVLKFVYGVLQLAVIELMEARITAEEDYGWVV
jgi:hypothetical protein